MANDRSGGLAIFAGGAGAGIGVGVPYVLPFGGLVALGLGVATGVLAAVLLFRGRSTVLD